MSKGFVISAAIIAMALPVIFIMVSKANTQNLIQGKAENSELIEEAEKTPESDILVEDTNLNSESEIIIESKADSSIKNSSSTTEIEKPAKTAVNDKPVATTTKNLPLEKISNINKVRWGVYVGYSEKELSDFEKMVGDESDMRGVFVNWNDEFPTEFGKGLKSDGKAMVIYWEQYGVSLDDIISGKSDVYIKEFAKAAETYGGEVILSPLHEMNGDWDPWGGMVGNNTPKK